MATAVQYLDFGIRTRNGVYWMMIVIAVSVINMVVLEFINTRNQLRFALSLFWLLMMVLATIKNLRRLGELEKTHPEPTDAMKLAFELTAVLPIVGMIPLMI
jgi:uncharacterized membrane protein YhaH (DUF805 family)